MTLSLRSAGLQRKNRKVWARRARRVTWERRRQEARGEVGKTGWRALRALPQGSSALDSDRSLLCAFGDEVLRRQRECMQRHGDNSVEGCLGETWKTGLRGAADLRCRVQAGHSAKEICWHQEGVTQDPDTAQQTDPAPASPSSAHTQGKKGVGNKCLQGTQTPERAQEQDLPQDSDPGDRR